MLRGLKAKYGALARRHRSLRSAHSVADYRRLVRRKLREHSSNRELALAQSTGSPTMEIFWDYGERQVQVLRHHGLTDGMAIYDLGCGCGRTAQALVRSGWHGNYTGADVVRELVEEITRTCPGFRALVNNRLSIVTPAASLDMVFHWSVFTHLYPAESYIYMVDIFRALKPGGRLVFSFLELEQANHEPIFDQKVSHIMRGIKSSQLNQFLHRDWIRMFARKIGFEAPAFVDGDDTTHHAAFGQSLVAMTKPLE